MSSGDDLTFSSEVPDGHPVLALVGGDFRYQPVAAGEALEDLVVDGVDHRPQDGQGAGFEGIGCVHLAKGYIGSGPGKLRLRALRTGGRIAKLSGPLRLERLPNAPANRHGDLPRRLHG